MLSALALGVVLQSPPAAFSKFEANFKGMKSVVAEFKITQTPGGVGSGAATLVASGKPNQRFSVRWGDAEYVYIQNRQGLLEFERSQKTYREYPPTDSWTQPPGGLEYMPIVVYPSMLISGRLDTMAPPGTPWKASANDTYTAEFTTQIGQQRIVVVVTPDGTLKSFSRTVMGVEGSTTSTLTFSRIVVNSALTNPDFRLNPPAGFRAEALPREPLPLSYGEVFPLKGWTGVDGKPTALGGRGRMLVVVAAPSCEPSRALLGFLEKNAARLNLGNLSWVIATDRQPIRGVAQRWRQVRGTSVAATDQLRSPGTPMMYLLEPNGAIVQVWQGYHPSMNATLAKELTAAIQRKPK